MPQTLRADGECYKFKTYLLMGLVTNSVLVCCITARCGDCAGSDHTQLVGAETAIKHYNPLHDVTLSTAGLHKAVQNAPPVPAEGEVTAHTGTSTCLSTP